MMTYTYDTMGRLSSLNDGSANVISSTTYGPAGELQAMGGGAWGSESRSYNAMLQMTYLSSGSVSIGYNYSSNQNNGKITSQYDYISGETVTYTYDSLNRLATAGASSWGQGYAYDGFGNLTDITSTLGTTPEWHVAYNAATNRNGSDVADANGNIGNGSYDVENRLIAPTWINNTTRYAYAPDNKRVWRGVWQPGPGAQTVDEITFWSVTGQRVGTYSLIPFSDSSTLRAQQTGTEYYFGGKLVKNAGGYVHADRLGSIGKYYPYGQERPSATQNGTEKFGTYFRDSDTGLDYADQRYHAPGQGRFLSPDPYIASGGPADPGSWNRYSYVEGDPINSVDPSGLIAQSPCVLYGQGSWACNPFPPDFWPGSPSVFIFGGNVNAYAAMWNCFFLPNHPGCPIAQAPSPRVRSAEDVTQGFYLMYQKKLNDCIQTVFGNDSSKVALQTLANAASINFDRTQAQLGAAAGPPIAAASGLNNPTLGANGTVYIGWEDWKAADDGALANIYGTYVHELGNILDAKLNPDAPAGMYERTYGHPGDPFDTDTGWALESCVFPK